MAEQTTEDRLSGFLRLRFGSVEREVPTLPLRPAREWVGKLNQGFLKLSAPTGNAAIDLAQMATEMVDEALALVVAYDRTGVLGREWLEENASPRQLRTALEVMKEEALPFDAREVGVLEMTLAALLAQQSSTNGHSPTGVSPQDHSRPRSLRASSPSSGKRAKSA